MYEPSDQAVPVATLFGNTYQTIKPFRIRWQGTYYTIHKVIYRHKYREDSNLVYVFSATDGLKNYFEILVAACDVRWMLGRVEHLNSLETGQELAA